MQITNTNLAMVRGDSEILTVSCTDSTGVAMPFVTGDTVYFTVKEKSSFTQKKIQKIITTFTDGKVGGFNQIKMKGV